MATDNKGEKMLSKAFYAVVGGVAAIVAIDMGLNSVLPGADLSSNFFLADEAASLMNADIKNSVFWSNPAIKALNIAFAASVVLNVYNGLFKRDNTLKKISSQMVALTAIPLTILSFAGPDPMSAESVEFFSGIGQRIDNGDLSAFNEFFNGVGGAAALLIGAFLSLAHQTIIGIAGIKNTFTRDKSGADNQPASPALG